MQENNDQPVPDITPEPTIPDTKIPQSQAEPSTHFMQPSLTPKKSHKPLLLIIIGIILLIGLGVGAFLLLRPQTTTQKDTTDAASSASSTELTSLIDSVASSLSGDITMPADRSAPIYNTKDAKFYVHADTAAAVASLRLTTTSKSDAETQRDAALTVLDDSNFILINTVNDILDDSLWASSTIVCNVNVHGDLDGATYNQSTNDYDFANYILDIDCANTADYAANLATIQPYFNAYKLSATYSDDMVFSNPENRGSESTGYDTATIPINPYHSYVGGFTGLFYKTPDNTWHYFMGSQSPLGCTDYNTTELKNAYLGGECFTESGASKVSL